MLEINFVFVLVFAQVFFFMQLLVYPLTFFSCYARDVGFSHMNTELKTAFFMQREDPFHGWWGDCFFFSVLT